MRCKDFALLICMVFAGNGLLGCNAIEKAATRTGTVEAKASKRSTNGAKRSEREICLETAKSVASKGHAREAILLYEKAERLKPDAEPLDRALAPLYAEVGDYDSATARYRNVIARQDRPEPDVHANLCWTLIEAGRLHDAEQSIQAGLSLFPDNPRLLGSRAVLHYERGNREQAFQVFRSLYGPSAAHHNLAILDLEHGLPHAALEQAQMAASFPNCPKQSVEFRNSLQAQIGTLPSSKPKR